MKNYKVFISITQDYWGKTVSTNFKQMDFLEACAHKKINPKNIIGKNKATTKQSTKREICIPMLTKVVDFVESKMNQTFDAEYSSSVALTEFYLTEFNRINHFAAVDLNQHIDLRMAA